MNWIIHFFVSIGMAIASLFGVHPQPAAVSVPSPLPSAPLTRPVTATSTKPAGTPATPVSAPPAGTASGNRNGSGTGVTTGTEGVFEGTASVASDCDIPACSETAISSLGILVRADAETVAAFKFNADGTYHLSLPVGTYFLYEDNDNWQGTDLTAQYSGDITSTGRVVITSGNITDVNIVIDNVKPNLSQ